MSSVIGHQPRPVFARKFGRRLDPLALHTTASLGYQELGKVKVNCRLRQSKSRWGVLGEAECPAGILYMDLSFDQPKGCRLSSATVLVTLEDDDSPGTYHRMPGSLEITDSYGPRQINGEPKTMAIRKTVRGVPQLTVLGNGGGGVGVDSEKTRTYTSRWSFTGYLLPGKDDRRNGARGTATHRTIKWELTENDLDARAVHSNVIHTGFAFQHDGEPCYLRVDIDGELQRTRDQIMQKFRFPPGRRKDQGSTLTRINLSQRDNFTAPLDRIASGLSRAMEMENYAEIPVEIPDSFTSSFQEVTPMDGQSETTTIFPPTNLLQTTQATNSNPPTSGITAAPAVPLLDAAILTPDPLVEMLAKALQDSAFSMETERLIPRSPLSTKSTTTLVEQRSQTEDIEETLSKDLDAAQEAFLRLSQSPMLLFLIGLLANLLDLFGKKSASAAELTLNDRVNVIEDLKEPVKKLPIMPGAARDSSVSGEQLRQEEFIFRRQRGADWAYDSVGRSL